MKHTIFTSPEYSTAGPQAKDGRVCVTTGEGAGGVLATGQALYYLGLWPRPPRLSPPWWHAPSHLWIEVSEGENFRLVSLPYFLLPHRIGVEKRCRGTLFEDNNLLIISGMRDNLRIQKASHGIDDQEFKHQILKSF